MIFSAYGVREGIIFEALSEDERKRDPLVDFCAEMAANGGRFRLDGEAVLAWMAPLFGAREPVPRRLRLAASWLADITGLDHPDYRGEHAFYRVLRMPVVGIDHPGRAFLALTLLTRYDGDTDAPFAADARRLAGPEMLETAHIAGLALRLAIAISSGSTDILSQTQLDVRDGELRLVVPPASANFGGEVVRRRFEDLARAAGRERAIIRAA